MPSKIEISLAALVVVAAASRILQASDVPPWRDRGDLPIPENARSVVPLREEVPILREPAALGERRGTALAGVRLPLYGAKRGSGCAARWLNVGPWSWICQDAAALDAEDPISFEPAPASANGLPYHYYYAGRDGARGYSRLEDAEDVAPEREFDAGFAVAIAEEAMHAGQRFGRTHHGLWIPLRELMPVTASSFHGEEVPLGKLDFGWAVEDRVPVFASSEAANAATSAATKAKGMRVLPRFERISILEEAFAPKSKTPSLPSAFRIGGGEWVRARDIARPHKAERPASVQSEERWIDVDLNSQTLVAYDGDDPVFATLVSTGRGREGTDSATPKGEKRIWVKLLSSNMENLEDESATHSYSIEDVPYVQYFASGVGLHGAFWHQGFGHVRSHGCVNLSPLDAQRLFEFTRPGLPTGWTAVLPTPHDAGTLVRVH